MNQIRRLASVPSTAVSAAISPPATIGMLGGGQLGRMFAQAAHTLGYHVIVFDTDPKCPAAQVADDCIIGQFDDPEKLSQFAELCDVVTLEWENIPTEAISIISGITAVHPSSDVLRIAQDRQREKGTLRDAGLPVTPFHSVNSWEDAQKAADTLSYPFVLKTARSGYDGKGQIKVTGPEQLEHAYRTLGGVPMIAEQWISYRREISVLVARNPQGELRTYPPFENHHEKHILDITLFPADVPPDMLVKIEQIAESTAELLGLIGILCIELFETNDGQILINEMAPRPHNSGHVTIEGAVTSQFEQHVRAVCGLPLGATEPRAFGAMANLLGDHFRSPAPNVVGVLSLPDTHLHLYGKDEVRSGRKMGHITVIADSVETAHERARSARDAFMTQ